MVVVRNWPVTALVTNDGKCKRQPCFARVVVHVVVQAEEGSGRRVNGLGRDRRSSPELVSSGNTCKAAAVGGCEGKRGEEGRERRWVRWQRWQGEVPWVVLAGGSEGDRQCRVWK